MKKVSVNDQIRREILDGNSDKKFLLDYIDERIKVTFDELLIKGEYITRSDVVELIDNLEIR